MPFFERILSSSRFIILMGLISCETFDCNPAPISFQGKVIDRNGENILNEIEEKDVELYYFKLNNSRQDVPFEFIDWYGTLVIQSTQLPRISRDENIHFFHISLYQDDIDTLNITVIESREDCFYDKYGEVRFNADLVEYDTDYEIHTLLKKD